MWKNESCDFGWTSDWSIPIAAVEFWTSLGNYEDRGGAGGRGVLLSGKESLRDCKVKRHEAKIH